MAVRAAKAIVTSRDFCNRLLGTSAINSIENLASSLNVRGPQSLDSRVAVRHAGFAVLRNGLHARSGVVPPFARSCLSHPQHGATGSLSRSRDLTTLIRGTPTSKRAFMVDTLQLVRRLEAQGLTAKQSEAITAVITEVLNESLENAAQSFVLKSDMLRAEMQLDAALSKFKSEVKSAQEHHFSTLQREADRLRTDVDRIRSELKYEIDKVTAGQRLDLNLEKGRMRDELATQKEETSSLANRLDRDLHSLKTQLEAAKYDVIKYCIGTIVSVTAVGLGLLRILM